MTTLIASTLHSADVILAGKRRDSRDTFRIDIPISIREVERGALKPAIFIQQPDPIPGKGYTLDALDGELWRPYVRSSRRIPGTYQDASNSEAERQAMTLDEFRALLGGLRIDPQTNYTDQDPLQRRHGIWTRQIQAGLRGRMHKVAKPAAAFPRLEDVHVKQLLWDDRAETERKLQDAAARMLVIDNKIWVRAHEPVLELTKFLGERQIRILDADTSPGYRMSIRHFRLDRMDDMRAWAAGQGKVVVPVPKGKGTVPVALRGAYEIIDPAVLKRDDARSCLAGRAAIGLFTIKPVLEVLPSTYLDSFLTLTKFVKSPDDFAMSTPQLYACTQHLVAGVTALSGLSDDQFRARDTVRGDFLPALARWKNHEQCRYGSSHDGIESELEDQLTP